MPNFLFSPAKINLGLRIVGRNTDNYHLLESIFLPLDFGDQIEISPSQTNCVSVEWAETALMKSALPGEEQNIVSKLLQHLPSKWNIKIKKNIPIGAGLGGGSSNAGTLLKFFVEKNALTKKEANKTAIQLGADVPFFMESQPCWVTGVGENCTPLKIKKETWDHYNILLVLIPEYCETKTIFFDYKNSHSLFSAPSRLPENTQQLKSYLQDTKNDLEATVASKYPLIKDVLLALRSTHHNFSSLSGSGSTCFGMYDCADDCEKTAKELPILLRQLGCKTVIAKILHVV